jgi:glutaminyl-peptide cyclotransferase
MRWFALIAIFSLSACDFSCKPKVQHIIPNFNADYAFDRILQYEKLGPKVPGSLEHKNAGNWIVAEMKSFGMKVQEQLTEATTIDGKKIPVRNIIASFRPELKKRILLSAHWDNRPIADQDTKNKNKPILGVNDGGSGVVVLMGIAKAISENPTANEMRSGIDFAFWDAEDSGQPSNAESYCLGSQHWAKNPIPQNYHAEFGINFDMVGRIGSVFPVENYSLEHAGEVIKKIHSAAKKIGYSDYFPTYRIGPIVDDHHFITEGLSIPMVDLIFMTPEGRFPPEWHTHDDTSEYISRDVLKAVAQTTIQVIFDSEKD